MESRPASLKTASGCQSWGDTYQFLGFMPATGVSGIFGDKKTMASRCYAGLEYSDIKRRVSCCEDTYFLSFR
jgi:hypothetical protein